MSTPNSPLAIRDEITITPTDDGSVVLDRCSGDYWQLNQTATFILQQIADGLDEPAIIDSLTSLYPDARDSVTNDASAILRGLVEAGVIRDE
ncbi:lasso peptide biosynthesis PqqD family chaperone [Glaciihabitans sp. UYNi722]|uniref:lasso peptide biosynthesis PqqD family chaperone n=1 Tax=Glaciihabitans sp. UYNi722 TaxID=3156344 RepID=UPI003399DC75